MTVVIAGTAGAEPERLARALHVCGWDGPTLLAGTVVEAAQHAQSATLAIVALDSSMPAADEEAGFLEAFAAARTPSALVACGVDAFGSWPKTLATSRAGLDPDHRLPVFATAVALLDEPDATSGVPELVAWCTDGPNPDHVPAASARAPRPGASRSPVARTDAQAAVRADRMAGLRAGIVAARAEAMSSTRAALTEIHHGSATEFGAAGFPAWLTHVLDDVDRRSRALFLDRLAQVQTAATRGLGASPDTSSDAPIPTVDPPGARTAAAGPDRRAAGAEDALLLMLGASMGFGVGRMVMAPTLAWAGLGVGGTVLSVLAGALMALWVMSVRRTSAERARTERWAVEQIAARRAAIEHWIGVCAGAAEAHVSREIWNRTRPTRV